MKSRVVSHSLIVFIIVSLEILTTHGNTHSSPSPPTSGEEGDERRLIKTSEYDPGTWMTEDEIFGLIRAGIRFTDETDHQDGHIETMKQDKDTTVSVIPKTVRYKPLVQSLIKSIDNNRLQAFIQKFSSFPNRYFNSKNGVESQQWLLKQIQGIMGTQNNKISVEEFPHSSWLQKSIIVRIEGSDEKLKDQVVIVGAHQDSINMRGKSLPAPGADDNASGSAVILESLRIITESHFTPRRSLEFHWYSAEEGGLKGSADIAKSYSKKGTKVVGMCNYDVTGYQTPGHTEIGVYTDNSHPALAQLLRTLTTAYLTYKSRDKKCGYGCSDHASWSKYKYPAVMGAEYVMHPAMHTTGDRLETISIKQIAEFVKLNLGFVVEMCEPMENYEDNEINGVRS